MPEPAGAGITAGGQQADKGSAEGSSLESCILLTNDRDRRTLRWLREQVGEDAIRNAITSLAGSRKLYVSNIVKALNISVPAVLEATDRQVALQQLASIKKILRR